MDLQTRQKCVWSFNKLKNKIEFALANEGSFGPHPYMPFFPCDHEILYFIDRKHNFHLHLSHLSEKTNYRMQSVASIEELQQFAQAAKFPSHALMMRPNSSYKNDGEGEGSSAAPIFKGIDALIKLEEAFKECIKYSVDRKVWVATDMRAQFNPSRMQVIAELAAKLAKRLQTHCPKCNTPGWGKIKEEPGLKCSWCNLATTLIKSEIFGCVKCDYEEKLGRTDGITVADPGSCQYCNP